MTNSEYLIQAKALIDRPEKWMKHRGSDGNGRFCVMGALYQVTGRIYESISYGELTNYLMKFVPSGWDDIVEFNDDARRTHAEIMAFMDQAIAAAEAQEMYAELNNVQVKPAPAEPLVETPEEVAA